MSGVALHLLRHGEPQLSGRLLGRTDCASTQAGIATCVDQAGALRIDAVVTSPLRRARAAADRIGVDKRIAVAVDPRWRELDFGRWDGLTTAQVARFDDKALAAFWDDPDASPPPAGERWSALCARVGAALAAIEVPSLVVTHGGPMRAALSLLCGLDQRQSWCVDLPYGALLSLRRYGDTAHITGLRLP